MSRSARDVATIIAQMLRDAGFASYFAGGCVRDELLGEQPKDYDVATNARPDEVAAIFRQTREVGKAFGVVQVRMFKVTVEVATFRREVGYSDKRRPDSVEFTNAEEDAKRRDFTINALFIDPLDTSVRPEGRVIDYVNGLGDLQAGIVRAVGDPEDRLAEDHLRALRGIRFASRFSFIIEQATSDAIRRHARDLAGVSRERIGEEVKRMLLHHTRAAAAELMTALELDAQVLNEPHDTSGHLRVLKRLPRDISYALAVAGWATDRFTQNQTSQFELARSVEEIVRSWRSALCLSNADRDQLFSILHCADHTSKDWHALDKAAKKRLAAAPGFDEALVLLQAVGWPDLDSTIEEYRRLAGEPGGIAPLPLVTGDDLITIGFCPGHRLGEVLSVLYDGQLAGRIQTKDAALAEARTYLKEGV